MEILKDGLETDETKFVGDLSFHPFLEYFLSPSPHLPIPPAHTSQLANKCWYNTWQQRSQSFPKQGRGRPGPLSLVFMIHKVSNNLTCCKWEQPCFLTEIPLSAFGSLEMKLVTCNSPKNQNPLVHSCHPATHGFLLVLQAIWQPSSYGH